MVGAPVKALKAREATVEHQQGARLQTRFDLIQQASLIPIRICLPDQVDGKLAGQIEQTQEGATMREARIIPQCSYLLEECFQLGGIGDPEMGEVRTRSGDHRWQGTGAGRGALLQCGQDGMHDLPEKGGRQGAQPEGECLLTHLPRRTPEQVIAGQHPHQFTDRGHLLPDQGDHQGHHDGQVQEAEAQAEPLILIGQGIGRRAHQFGQMLLDDGIERGRLVPRTSMVTTQGGGFVGRHGTTPRMGIPSSVPASSHSVQRLTMNVKSLTCNHRPACRAALTAR